MRNDDPFADLIRSLEENLQRNAGTRPVEDEGGSWVPPRRPTTDGPPFNGRRFLWIFLPILLLIFFSRIISFYADWLWYESLDFTAVFTTRIWAQFGLFITISLLCWLFLAVNILIARRIEPRGFVGTAFEQIASALRLRLTNIILALGGLVALIVGAGASGNWEEVLLYLNHGDFGLADPLFNQDVSFFLFTLPVWQLLRNLLFSTILLTLVASGLVYGIGWRGWNSRRPVLTHLSLLGALLLILVAWQYRLDAYQLVYSARGTVTGAGYTDVNAQLPAYNLLALVTLVTAIVLVVTVYLRTAWRAILMVLGLWVAVAVVAGNLYPSFVQRFQVTPNELNLERPFIEQNIKYTRLAFDLADIESIAYDASVPLTAAAIRTEPETVRNIRLWDYRPLLQTYNQIQALRQYYEFNDIDIDRYMIDGELRQVMLAARELAPERLNTNAQTWVNRKLVYTHGYGVAASPVAQVTQDGLPEFLLKDLPPTGVITVTQPQIYFGERPNEYVIARTNEPEFDYPSGEQNVTSRFTADTGIDMSWGTRLLFALHFTDINLLLNSDINADSQLLWRRNITTRATLLAPFLRFDPDPYLVISDEGKLYWFQDAYTVSNRFPYSEQLEELGFNYIRNSVKVVTNAYSGEMVFYIVDESEPIIAAYAQLFPDLFQPLSQMPADLLDNIRYPNGIFTVQANVFRTYHMTDANEFYNKEDVWAWPREIFDDETQNMEPYYVLMQLPGSDELKFIQILPFTPANRENMIAWLTAQSEPENYGQKVVYEFGKDSLVYGPMQVEARINQDPEISAQLSLWNRQGSNVIRGNLLVIPIGESLIYVEPLFLQASTGNIPELARVIVATANRVVMEDNLGVALARLFGEEVVAEAGLDDLATGGDLSGAPSTAAPIGEDTSMEGLIEQANQAFVEAQTLLRDGDWAGYGAQMERVRTALEGLIQLTAPITSTDTAPLPEATPSN